jgi:uncharacterized protein (TIGR00730 family)
MNRRGIVHTLSLRLLRRSLWDFAKSMSVLRPSGPCITILGSARLGEEGPHYDMARALGRSLGQAGFSIMTGGGPSLMEAANRGAMEAGAPSLGCRMAFSFEQQANLHVDRCATVRYFFVRKVVMCRSATGFAVLPGGMGTLDELFEILALIQTKRMPPKPIVLLGRDYWRPLLVLLEGMVAAGTVAPGDMALITVTDDICDAVTYLAERTGAAPRRLVENPSPAPSQL